MAAGINTGPAQLGAGSANPAADKVMVLLADGGAAAFALLDEVVSSAAKAGAANLALATRVINAAKTLREATQWLVEQRDLDDRFAGATSYLHAFARVLGAHYHLKAATTEGEMGPRTALAQYYITRLLPQHEAALAEAKAGAAGVFSLSTEALRA